MNLLFKDTENIRLSYFFLRILNLAIPISLCRIIYLLSGFIAILMLGQLGKLHVAAGVLAIPTFSIAVVFTSSIFQALSILIRKTPSSQKSLVEISALFQSSIFLSVIVGLLTTLLIWHADNLLVVTGQELTIITISRLYFQISAVSIIPTLIITVINQLNIGIGRPNTLLYIELLCFVPRIILYYGFIQGHWGLPALGLSGVALAELLIKYLILIILIIHFCISKFYQPFRHTLFLHKWIFNKKLIKMILGIGLPIALQSSGEITAMLIAGYSMGSFGATALAALSVTNQYMILIMAFAYGLSQTLTLLISEIKDTINAHKAIITCLLSALLIMVIYLIPFIIFFLKFPIELLSLFLPLNIQDANLQSLSASFFIIAIFFILIDGVRNIVIGILWVTSKSRVIIMHSLGITWFIALPLGYVFAFIFDEGPIGLRFGLLLGLTISLVLLSSILYYKLSKPLRNFILPVKQLD
ncbi:MATE family efflux transporter [Legionella gresilensis]|uniref:MATE family efflux transporter n=1 Tax=Legionella gresilensis TaxID=91823 RepID=UPI001041798F|nr:MATE family efflux transporter [Legionella gresilensis]